MWKEILTIWGTGGVLVVAAIAAAAWLVRALIGHGLSGDLERTKAALKAQHDAAIVRLRAEFQIDAIKSEAHYAKVHARVLEVIGELYSGMHRINKAHQAMLLYADHGVAPDTDKFASRARTLGDAITPVRECFDYNRIYLRPELAHQIDQFITAGSESYLEARYTEPPGEHSDEARLKLHESMKAYGREVSQQLIALESEFQGMMYGGPAKIYGAAELTEVDRAPQA